MKSIRLCGAVLVLLATTSASVFAAPTNQAAALSYLEPRVHSWISERGCVSCHTVVPFVVSQITPDALNRTAYQDVLKLVTDRTQNFASRDPWYDDGEHADQSKATESVLNALILAQTDRLQGLTNPSALTTLAFKKMKELQENDGSWLWLNFEMEPWESAAATPYGASLAAVALARSKARNAATNASMILKMKTYLVKSIQDPHVSLWAKVSILWAEAEFGGIIPADQLSSVLTAALSKQLASGGWSMNQLGNWKKYGSQRSAGATTADGYASAYLTYVLKQLKASRRVPSNLSANVDAAYSKGVDWLIHSQDRDGFWESASLQQDNSFNQSLNEDAATGFAIAVLAN